LRSILRPEVFDVYAYYYYFLHNRSWYWRQLESPDA
jgi:hypothetical protein